MDHALIVPPEPTKMQRQQDPKITKLFLKFLGFDQVPDVRSPAFNVDVYKARLRVTIETLLLESDDRAAQNGRTAYVHLVGLGLGVWVYHKTQPDWFAESVAHILLDLHLKHVSTLELAWVFAAKKQRDECIAAGNEVGIKVVFNQRPPCQKLETGELLVRCWAWDSNTLPGNEYWSGIIDNSDDPAAVCNSTAAELHNPYVNPFAHRIKVLQDRTRV